MFGLTYNDAHNGAASAKVYGMEIRPDGDTVGGQRQAFLYSLTLYLFMPPLDESGTLA